MHSDKPLVGTGLTFANVTNKLQPSKCLAFVFCLMAAFNLMASSANEEMPSSSDDAAPLCVSGIQLYDVELCDGAQLALYPELTGAVTPITYSWSGPNGLTGSSNFLSISNVDSDDAGTYAITVVDGNNCEVNTSVEVTVLPPPELVFESVEVSCIDSDPVELVASPAGGIFAGAGVIDGVYFDPSITGGGLHPIVYSYTDANGCSNTITNYANVDSGQNLSCKGDLNVSLDENCSLSNLSVGLFLDSQLDPQFFTYVLKDQFDNIIPLEDIGSFAGECVIYEVIDICSGNICWGNMCIEDKIAPANFNCDCETPYMDDGTGNLIENPDCVFYSYDIWDLEILEAPGGANQVLPSVNGATPVDNCTVFDDADISIQIFPNGDDCVSTSVVRTISYSYLDYDGQVQIIDCQQTFLFKRVDLYSSGTTENGAWDGHPDIFTAYGNDGIFAYYTPEKKIEMPCGSDLTPESIAAHYDIDTPTRPEGIDKDDFNQTPSIVEYNEGIPYAYPYVVVQGWK